jgi:hypothetical protein
LAICWSSVFGIPEKKRFFSRGCIFRHLLKML